MKYIPVLILFAMALAFSCAGNRVQKMNDLPDRLWKLIELEGKAIVDSGERYPHAVFKTTGNRVYGSGGCNRFSGNWQVSGQKITISEIISTKMACMEIDYENDFFRILESADEYMITGDSLLFKNNGFISARFVLSDSVSSPQITN